MLIIKTFALFAVLVSASPAAGTACTGATVCPEDEFLAIPGNTAADYDGAAVVDLHTAGDFAILTAAGVSATGATAVTGDVGVSPAAQSYLTGFALPPLVGCKAKSSLVTGDIYAANQCVPIPAKMTVAIGDLGIASAAAAGAGPAGTYTVLNLEDGLIDNQVLGPGYYKWGSSVAFDNELTFSGAAADVWILQIAGSIKVGAGANVTLVGGAQAQNIFWQTDMDVSVGTDAHVEGIFLASTKMAFEAGSSLNGRALSKTAVTLSGTTITQPSTRRRRNLRA